MFNIRNDMIYPLALIYICGVFEGCDEKRATDEVEALDMMMAHDAEIEETAECPWIADGVCDEPHACALGTDEMDCGSVCTATDIPVSLKSVCDWRLLRQGGLSSNLIQSGQGSLGSGGNYGHLSGVILTRSGEDPSRQVARHYRAFVPRSYRAEIPMPLLFMLPGHRVAVDPLAEYTQLIATADQEGFILVFAEQEVRSADQRWAWWTDWPWSQGSTSSDHPDLLFLETLVQEFKSKYNIDGSRVFVTGHSRGASMALIAALERPDLFAAAVSESGFTEFGYEQRLIQRDQGLIKPSIILLHGDLDPDVCIDCRPGAQCAVTGRACGSIFGSDALAELFNTAGWNEENFRYYRLKNVTHRWQPQLNSALWSWLKNHPMVDSEQSFMELELSWPSQATLGTLNEDDAKPPHAPNITDEAMIAYPMASFEMGNPVESPEPYGDGWFMDQTPITLTRLDPFKLDITEVTVARYAEFLNHVGLSNHYHPMMPIEVRESGYYPYEDSENKPISGVSWENASAYCQWRGKRLPLEAEWEFVSSGGGRRAYPWLSEGGVRCFKAVSFIGAAQCEGDLMNVGGRPEGNTPEGLTDLIGNVAEWTADLYVPYPGNEDQGAWLDSEDQLYSVRGGGLFNSGSWLTSRSRWSATASARGQTLGFRCALSENNEAQDPYEGVRGTLLSSSSLDLRPSPLAEASMKGKRVISGLKNPYDFEPWLDGFLISEPDFNRILFADNATGEFHELINEVSSPQLLAVQGNRLLLSTENELIEWADEQLSLVQSISEPITQLVADEEEAFWVTGGILYHQLSRGEVIQLAEIPEEVKLVLTSSALFITSRAQGSGDRSVLWKVDRTAESRELETLLSQISLPSGFMLYDVSISPSHQVTLALRRDVWPYVGRICDLELNDLSLTCFSDSPPQLSEVEWIGDELYWASKRSISRLKALDGTLTYEVVSEWHSPQSLKNINGIAMWLNPLSGSLWSSQ